MGGTESSPEDHPATILLVPILHPCVALKTSLAITSTIFMPPLHCSLSLWVFLQNISIMKPFDNYINRSIRISHLVVIKNNTISQFPNSPEITDIPTTTRFFSFLWNLNNQMLNRSCTLSSIPCRLKEHFMIFQSNLATEHRKSKWFIDSFLPQYGHLLSSSHPLLRRFSLGRMLFSKHQPNEHFNSRGVLTFHKKLCGYLIPFSAKSL